MTRGCWCCCALALLSLLGEGVRGDRKKRPDDSRFNFASGELGAKVMAANPGADKSHHLLFKDRDKYYFSPTKLQKWVVIELTEEIRISAFALAAYEYYCSVPKEVLLLGSKQYPCKKENSCMWTMLGNFTANDRWNLQYFDVARPTMLRYLKVLFVGHWGKEPVFTVSEVRVHGSNFFDEFSKMDDPPDDDDEDVQMEQERSPPERAIPGPLVPYLNKNCSKSLYQVSLRFFRKEEMKPQKLVTASTASTQGKSDVLKMLAMKVKALEFGSREVTKLLPAVSKKLSLLERLVSKIADHMEKLENSAAVREERMAEMGRRIRDSKYGTWELLGIILFAILISAGYCLVGTSYELPAQQPQEFTEDGPLQTSLLEPHRRRKRRRAEYR